MRKILSLFIAVLMIAAIFAASVPSAAIEGIKVAKVKAPYFDVKPTVDGVVSEAEWGTPTITVDQAEVGNSKYIAEGDTPSANDLNTFFFKNLAGKYDAASLNMKYTLWLRWDEDYYYIAVKVKDPDGHSLKNGKNETWNGDAFQTRIDPGGYNASCPLGPEAYDAEYDNKPWSRWDIDDLCFGFNESAGGFTEVWNNATNVGMTAFSGGTCKAAVIPAGVDFNADTAAGITTYEIAIPWKYIGGAGAVGREYGMSAVVYNADGQSGGMSYNAALAWGSGILNYQQDRCPQTCGGSNKVTLTGNKVSEDGSYTGDYETGSYCPAPPPVRYPTEIDESVHVFLDYEDESDMDVYGYFRGGEWVREPGNTKNHVARWDLDEETESGYNEENYLSTESDIYGEYTYSAKDCSYTMEYDVKVTGTEIFEPGYDSELYNWFGGPSLVEYECGYNFDEARFFVKEMWSQKILESRSAVFTLNEWHHIVFQYCKDSCEIRYYFDPQMENGRVSEDAVPVFSMIYRYFDCPGMDEIPIILRRMNCQIMLDNVEFYNFVDYEGTCEHKHIKKVYTTEPTFTQSGVYDLVCADCGKTIESGSEAPRLIPGDADMDGNVNMKDVLLMRKVIAGAEQMDEIQLICADLNGDGDFNMKDVLKLRKVIAGAEEIVIDNGTLNFLYTPTACVSSTTRPMR